jgi:protocatechuate 3,4-dioxygenase beta subunit
MRTIFLNHARQHRHLFLLTSLLFSVVIAGTSCRAQTKAGSATAIVGGGCDGCELIFEGMPHQMSWQTAMASPSEPGERMEISGVIYQRGGRTPASNVILYVYHTDARGLYSPAPDATGAARRHGHLRGWMKTNERGEYKFTSIRPAQYPSRQIAAHVHPIIKEPDKNEYWIDEYLFDDDPIVAREQQKEEKRGGSGIIHLTKNSEGVWMGRRDIILGLNIPNYR